MATIKLLKTALLAGCVLAGSQVWAADPAVELTSAQKHKMMKDCMMRKKAADADMSSADMKQACMEEMKKPTVPSEKLPTGGPDQAGSTPH